MTELWNFLRGALMTKALAAVVEAGVPEALADGPRPVSTLFEGAGFRVESLGNPIVATCR